MLKYFFLVLNLRKCFVKLTHIVQNNKDTFFFKKKKCVREQHLEKNDIVETLDVSMYNVPKAGKELG